MDFSDTKPFSFSMPPHCYRWYSGSIPLCVSRSSVGRRRCAFSARCWLSHLRRRPRQRFWSQRKGSRSGRAMVALGLGLGELSEGEELKQGWVESLRCPFGDGGVGGDWVLGVDPDNSDALAVVRRSDCGVGFEAQAFDSPVVPVLVGKWIRRRLDPRSIVQLLQSLDAPMGTKAYIEQSMPFPHDGKQGWWSGGFGYGLWIGILVASGFSVVAVPFSVWKNLFELSGNGQNKDDSRRVASDLFPSLSDWLKRKKDPGRAVALLITTYGKDLKLNSPCLVEETIS